MGTLFSGNTTQKQDIDMLLPEKPPASCLPSNILCASRYYSTCTAPSASMSLWPPSTSPSFAGPAWWPTRREGKQVYFSVNHHRLAEVMHFAGALLNGTISTRILATKQLHSLTGSSKKSSPKAAKEIGTLFT